MPLSLTEHDIPISDLDPAHEGLIVVHVTDLHVGLITPEKRIRHAIALANRAAADLVVLTGDYVCYGKRFVALMGEVMRGLEARAGVVATLGNHDYWTDGEGVAKELRRNGYDVLRNDHVTLRPRGAPLTVVGIDDAITGHHDPARAFSGTSRTGTVLTLSHCPELADAAADRGAHLVVAGHTHGGHLHVRGLTDRVYRRLTKRRYLSGWYDVGERTALYVNRGVGSSSVPVRAGEGAKSEVAVFRLCRAA
ncbi:MAG: metallophosphoesterase [Deltaproteobacteria bacterium]|nr:metallophosphoesterase [Deltaproteobacteria bacterium]